MAQVSQKKYYDIQHSRNFKFTKNNVVIKFLPRNSQRKGGKLDDKFSGPYVIDEIMDLGIARLRTLKGKVLKKGVPIKQLQKYNKKDDEGNYSNASSETENKDQPRKRRRLSSDAESSKSNVDVMSGTVHHVDSNTMSEKHEKQEGTLSVKWAVTPVKQDQATLSVKQSVTPVKQDQATLSVKWAVTPAKQDQATLSVKWAVTPAKQDQATLSVKQSVSPTKQDQATLSVKWAVTPAKQDQVTLSVKQSVTPTKQDQATLSVKQSVTPTKQDQVTLSVKQSVTWNMVNDKELFTCTPTNATYNKKKIRLTPMISPITQLKGGIKTTTTQKKILFSTFHRRERENRNENRIMWHTPRLG